jgi:hypothetical protein
MSLSFNKDLMAMQQVASPKSAEQTSLNSDINRNSPSFLARLEQQKKGVIYNYI